MPAAAGEDTVFERTHPSTQGQPVALQEDREDREWAIRQAEHAAAEPGADSGDADVAAVPCREAALLRGYGGILQVQSDTKVEECSGLQAQLCGSSRLRVMWR